MEEMFDALNERGEFTNTTVSRKECHLKGIVHRAVVVFVINSNNQILLQKRSKSKKQWPNLWDITAGGHVLAGEFGYQAVIREAKEEIHLDIKPEELLFIGSTTSRMVKDEIVDCHFNEFYILKKDVLIDNLEIQEEEVQDIRWFSKDDVIKRIHNHYDGLTEKQGCWEFLEKYLEFNS